MNLVDLASVPIITANYSTMMSEILNEGRVGRFCLKKKMVLGGVMQSYDPENGRLYYGRFDNEFNAIVLMEDNDIWMSDIPLEQESIRNPVRFARGKVLTAGLGLGMFPMFIRDKEDLESVDIVELTQEVIELVGAQIRYPKFRFINDDIHHYLATTNRKYDFVYIDVWRGTVQPISNMENMHREVERVLASNGKSMCWMQELYDKVKKKLPKELSMGLETGLFEPCPICGKVFRDDFAGLCMDCADTLGVGALYFNGTRLAPN